MTSPYSDIVTAARTEIRLGTFGVAIILVCITSFVLVWRTLQKARHKLPPGPRGLPLLGNAHQLPVTFPERALYKWGKKYGTSLRLYHAFPLKTTFPGDIVYFKVFQSPAIVLNSIDAARDLLDKRGSIYSARPRLVMLSEM